MKFEIPICSCFFLFKMIWMEAQLVLSFSVSTPPPVHIWDLIGWLQCPSLLCDHPWPSFISSSSSINAARQHDLHQTEIVSLCFSFVFSLFLTSVTSSPFYTITFPIFCQFLPVCSLIAHQSFYTSLHQHHSHVYSFPHNIMSLSPSLLFPCLFFSLSDNDTGKFAPATLRTGLPKSCQWMLHGALVWCMQCNTGGILVHGEHCERCKAGLVLKKLKVSAEDDSVSH